MNYDKIIEAYKEEFIGKQFTYKSKYGGKAVGIVEEVYYKIICDIISLTDEIEVDKLSIKHEYVVGGDKLQIYIRSEDGIVYGLTEDNLFFTSKINITFISDYNTKK
jgi:hypothetical protein